MKVLVIHGAGMNMRGKAQTEIFGPMTLAEYDEHIRKYAAELGIKVEVGRFFDAVLHPYPDPPVLLLLYHCRIEEGNAKPLKSRGLLWASPRELKELAMPAADDPIRQHLLSVEEEILSKETF